ncbi:capsular exopolysaccharide synthesis family protein [Chitinophaga niastensis]|uniref:non-specific protein-tyrosine kinase n=1 Tax=Chitinophaga niastensis TaxID=536980 RepID=A0A2P8HFE2_CHINA|nr:tyrosine-protein kinase family protein [Chitinophaga niastensis]PSL44893.1 capsular exopolysaccharide synthesis family protein [Chitinophaga niastensis]
MQENLYQHLNGKKPLNGHSGTQHTDEPASTLDLRKILDSLMANWYWFVLSILLTGSLGFTYLRYATPAYKINAKILVEDQQKGSDIPGAEILQQMELFTSKSNVDNEMEIVNSRSLMEKVVRDEHLYINYLIDGHFKKSELYVSVPFTMEWQTLRDSLKMMTYEVKPVGTTEYLISRENAFSRKAKWNDTIHLPEGILQLKRNREVALDRDLYTVQLNSIDKTVAEYQRMLDVNIPNKQVSTIDLTLSATIPAKGEAVLNKLIDAYLHASVEDKNRIADSTIAFIDKRLLIVTGELSGVEKNIQHFKEANELADIGEQSRQMVAGSGDFRKQLIDLQVKLNVVQSLEQYVKDDKNNKRVVPSAIVVQDPTFVSIVEKYNTLQLERERLLLSSTDANPLIRNMDGQLAGLRLDLMRNLGSFKNGLQVSIDELERNSGMLNQKIKKVPSTERVFLDYSRQQAIKQELYLFLLKKREESAITKSSNLATARIIDAAKSDPKPYKPKGLFIYLISFIFGMAFPAGILYLRDVLSRRITGREHITKLTPAPILAEIGHNYGGQKVVVTKDTRTPLAEQFRALRTNLQFIMPNQEEKVILLTSSMSGEGKSFVATNLAAVLALSGKKVVLLELDLRKPRISEQLGISNHMGFSTYVIGKSPLETIIKPSGIHDNCWLISSGPIPPNPAELMLLDKTALLFAELREQFDYIVVDTAPVGLVTDAQLLGRFADATLYLMRQGYTFKEQAKLSKDLYNNRKMPCLNLIINDVKTSGSYGYGYGYGYGYMDDEANGNVIKKIKKVFSK